MSKLILIDASVLAFKSIFNYELAIQHKKEGGFILPSSYSYVAMIISCLKKIGVNEKEDIVIMCQDDRSWRKQYLASYKANRKELREKHKIIDWEKEFAIIGNINKQLDYATPFYFLRIPNAEADDIMSVACRVFTDKEIIIVSIDSDLKQLCYYPNVKYFSYMVKVKGSSGGYVEVENPIGIIDEKVKKGDKSDNILVSPDDDENDVELRRQIVNLLSLPEFVEEPIKKVLLNLPLKTPHYNELPFQKSLGQRFFEIYNKDSVITYDYCIKLAEKRVKRRNKKK
jgi:hypothetical protein